MGMAGARHAVDWFGAAMARSPTRRVRNVVQVRAAALARRSRLGRMLVSLLVAILLALLLLAW